VPDRRRARECRIGDLLGHQPQHVGACPDRPEQKRDQSRIQAVENVDELLSRRYGTAFQVIALDIVKAVLEYRKATEISWGIGSCEKIVIQKIVLTF